MTFSQWLERYCVNRARLANMLGTTRQAVASWADGDGIPAQYEKFLVYIWGAENVPATIFTEATRELTTKLVEIGDELVWLD